MLSKLTNLTAKFYGSFVSDFQFTVFLLWLVPDDSEASEPDQDEVIDPNELLQVSTEHGRSSSSQAINGIVNEITKQQMVVQFLKVGLLGYLRGRFKGGWTQCNPANNFFPISLSYARPGTRFDLTSSHFGWTKREERIICISVRFRRFFRQTVTLNPFLSKRFPIDG